MRIAIAGPLDFRLLDQWTGGDERLPRTGLSGGTPVAHLVAGLLDRGHEIVAVTHGPGLRSAVEVRRGPLVVHAGPHRSGGRSRDLFAPERHYVAATLSSERCDVVHAQWVYEYALGALRSGHPTVTTVHDWPPTILRFNPTPYRAARLAMSAATFAKGRHFTTPSDYLRRVIRRWTGRDATVVPNAVDDDAFVAPDTPVPTNRDPRLVAINNGFDRRKNVGTLLEAFADVRRRHRRAELALIGKQYEPGGRAERWASDAGLRDGVEFVGPLPNPAAMARLAAADLFVHPSREESFGLVLIEAMARKVPVVGGRSSGAVPHVLDGGRAGRLVDVSSADDLAAAIADLLEHPDHRGALAVAGYDHARREFQRSRVLERYESVYARVRQERP